MQRYIKNGVIKTRYQITVCNDEVGYVMNPEEELILADGWEIYVQPEKSIEQVRRETISAVTNYDKSQEVNSFFIGEVQAWIDRDTRVSLMNSTNILKSMGQESTTLWLGNKSYTLLCDLVIQLLGALEVYVLQCYNTTAQHKANIDKIETIEELKEYNYKVGYPEKLVFNV